VLRVMSARAAAESAGPLHVEAPMCERRVGRLISVRRDVTEKEPRWRPFGKQLTRGTESPKSIG